MAHTFDPAGREAVAGKWAWFIALGVILIMCGGIAFGNLLMATVASVYYVGLIMLIGGLLNLAHAFQVKSWESVLYWVLSGACYAAAGLFAFINPALASSILTFLMAVALIVAGGFRIWVGFKLRPLPGWGWIVIGGLVTLAAGLIIAAGWPVDSLWILGLFLAVDLVMQGLALIAFGVLAKG
ncbi:HdeD family acid-resistance protein [Sinorhizobium garamanticum]|uniref:HdeD family acid-resistance protein n=1 Tax=Sinorhizobium garamanticum TaxID=680247 RepID=A0ABY8DA42_9HYPH|nr:HdeD family acid-resistance protein [Sinorhizobium garamanticum]WEX87751.1 HdeD family acid-resistance protein [Sinorhizobium garamanticum]